MSSNPQLAGPGWQARALTPDEVPALQALLERARDYHECVYGEGAAPGAAQELVDELPPGTPREHKHVFGLWRGELLIGVIDVLAGHRAADEWYLGTLLLDPAERRHGIGASVLAELERWVSARGANAIRLACAEQNEGGLAFWRRHGFVDDRVFPPRAMGRRHTVLIELVKRLHR